MRGRSNVKIKVSDIAMRLEGGQTTAQILKEYTQKLGCSRRTVERYITLARDIVSRSLKKREALIEFVRADIIAEEAEKWLKSNLEIEAKLCAIMSGKVQFNRLIQTKDGVQAYKCYPTCREMLGAMNILLRMRGAYKIAEIADDTIKPTITIVVDTEREKELLESIDMQRLEEKGGGGENPPVSAK